MQLNEGIRDLEISWLKKTKDNVFAGTLVGVLDTKYKSHLPYLKQKLERIAETVEKAGGEATNEQIESLLNASEAILANLKEDDVSRYFGVQHNVALGGEKERSKAKEMQFQKEVISLSYRWKATSYKLLSALNDNKEQDKYLTLFDESLGKYSQWITSPATNDGNYLLLWGWREGLRGYHGTVLKALNKYIAEPKNASNEEIAKGPLVAARELRVKVLEKLGYSLWVEYEQKWNLVKYPKEYPSF